MNLKHNEIKIISHLRKDSRESLTKLSRETSIPVSTIFDKLKHQVNSVIRKNTCIVDFNKLGLTTRAKIVLKVKPEDRENIKKSLLKNRNVNSLYRINNGYDYMVDVVFRNLKELEEFLEKLDGDFRLKSRLVFYVIDEIECEKFMAKPEDLPLIEL